MNKPAILLTCKEQVHVRLNVYSIKLITSVIRTRCKSVFKFDGQSNA